MYALKSGNESPRNAINHPFKIISFTVYLTGQSLCLAAGFVNIAGSSSQITFQVPIHVGNY